MIQDPRYVQRLSFARNIKVIPCYLGSSVKGSKFPTFLKGGQSSEPISLSLSSLGKVVTKGESIFPIKVLITFSLKGGERKLFCNHVPEVICGEVSGSVEASEHGEGVSLGEPELDLAVLVTTDDDARGVSGELVTLPALYWPLPPE